MSDKIHDWRELDLQSLDLVLCAGESKMSKRIAKFQRLTGAPPEAARFTHVGGIKNIAGTSPNWVAVQESTSLNKWANKSGVQMNAMDIWLLEYNGKVYIRKMRFDRTEETDTIDRTFWKYHRNDPYESGIMGGLELFLCGLGWDKHIRKVLKDYKPLTTKKLHCTEKVAMRIYAHKLWENLPSFNRLPPWKWVSEIDDLLACPVGELVRIK